MTYSTATVHPDPAKCGLCNPSVTVRLSEEKKILHDRYHAMPEKQQWLLMWVMRSLLKDLANKKPPGIRLSLGPAGLLEIVFRAGRYENRLA